MVLDLQSGLMVDPGGAKRVPSWSSWTSFTLSIGSLRVHGSRHSAVSLWDTGPRFFVEGCPVKSDVGFQHQSRGIFSQYSQEQEGVWFGNYLIASLKMMPSRWS